LGKSLILPFLKKTARRLISHIRHNPTLWISLAVFSVVAWLLTSTSCTLRAITGLPCPGCGLTRGLLAALRGDLAEAFRMHPLFWLAPVILLAVLALLVFWPDLLNSRAANHVWLALAGLFIGVYLVRMILYFPTAEPLTYNPLSVFGRLWGLIQAFGVFP